MSRPFAVLGAARRQSDSQVLEVHFGVLVKRDFRQVVGFPRHRQTGGETLKERLEVDVLFRLRGDGARERLRARQFLLKRRASPSVAFPFGGVGFRGRLVSHVATADPSVQRFDVFDVLADVVDGVRATQPLGVAVVALRKRRPEIDVALQRLLVTTR